MQNTNGQKQDRPTQRWGLSQRDLFEATQNGILELAMTDKKVVRGRLRGYDEFSIIIEPEGGGEMVCLWKHAIKWARPGARSAKAAV